MGNLKLLNTPGHSANAKLAILSETGMTSFVYHLRRLLNATEIVGETRYRTTILAELNLDVRASVSF